MKAKKGEIRNKKETKAKKGSFWSPEMLVLSRALEQVMRKTGRQFYCNQPATDPPRTILPYGHACKHSVDRKENISMMVTVPQNQTLSLPTINGFQLYDAAYERKS